MKKIKINKILNSTTALFHSEGLKIYKHILAEIILKNNVELSFKNIDFCSTQFLNASVGKLYLNQDKKFLDEYLKITNTNSDIDFALNRVIKNASNNIEYDKRIYEAISEL